MEADKIDEVGVLGHHHSTGLPRRLEDHQILSIAKTQIPYRLRFNIELGVKPSAKRGGELRVEPDLHAATIG